MKNLFLIIAIFLLCSKSESKFDNFKKYRNEFIEIQTDSPATISWQNNSDVIKYYLYCRYDHDDTSWFILDSICQGDTSYLNNSRMIYRPDEVLSHSCKEDSLFFLSLQSVYSDTFINDIRFYVDSSICWRDWVLWKTRVIPLKPLPMRVRE